MAIIYSYIREENSIIGQVVMVLGKNSFHWKLFNYTAQLAFMKNFHHLLNHLMIGTAEIELSVKMFTEVLSKGRLYPDKVYGHRCIKTCQAKSMLKSFNLV